MTGRPVLLPGQPHDDGGAVFREPWEAHAFAITLALHERGGFTWGEFAHTLANEIAAAQAAGDADLGDTYYRYWLAALEQLIAAKGLSSTAELARYRRGWVRAAQRTPHGIPIELLPEDFTAADLLADAVPAQSATRTAD